MIEHFDLAHLLLKLVVEQPHIGHNFDPFRHGLAPHTAAATAQDVATRDTAGCHVGQVKDLLRYAQFMR